MFTTARDLLTEIKEENKSVSFPELNLWITIMTGDAILHLGRKSLWLRSRSENVRTHIDVIEKELGYSPDQWVRSSNDINAKSPSDGYLFLPTVSNEIHPKIYEVLLKNSKVDAPKISLSCRFPTRSYSMGSVRIHLKQIFNDLNIPILSCLPEGNGYEADKVDIIEKQPDYVAEAYSFLHIDIDITNRA